MRPPKLNAHISLIGTILIMWLMVGYVYLLTPLEPVDSKSSEAQETVLPLKNATPHVRESDQVDGERLTVELEKGRFQPREPVLVVVRLSGPRAMTRPANLASLLIENETQILGPVTFTKKPDSQDYICHIVTNPATGQPLPAGIYKVVVRANANLVAAVTFEVAAPPIHLAYQR